MARPIRTAYDNAVHNVTVRDNYCRDMFYTAGGRERFINRHAESIRLYEHRYIFSPS